jgi:hypothetical protein
MSTGGIISSNYTRQMSSGRQVGKKKPRLIERKDEVMTIAPTGIASDKIGGNTYHTTLTMPIVNRKEKTSLPPRINTDRKDDYDHQRDKRV